MSSACEVEAEIDVDRAFASSVKKTIIMEEVFVRKSKNTSAGRLRETCDEMERRNDVKVSLQAVIKVCSLGRMGEYHHLFRRCQIPASS